MPKTITVRVEEDVYNLLKKAAEGQKRTISNYIEYATINYTINETIVDDIEMQDIMGFSKEIKKGLADISAGRYAIVG